MFVLLLLLFISIILAGTEAEVRSTYSSILLGGGRGQERLSIILGGTVVEVRSTSPSSSLAGSGKGQEHVIIILGWTEAEVKITDFI